MARESDVCSRADLLTIAQFGDSFLTKMVLIESSSFPIIAITADQCDCRAHEYDKKLLISGASDDVAPLLNKIGISDMLPLPPTIPREDGLAALLIPIDSSLPSDAASTTPTVLQGV